MLGSHLAPLSWHSSSCGVASAESCSLLCLFQCSARFLAGHSAPQACVCTLLCPRSLPLVQVTADAAADLPPSDALKEGGDSASQRKCTFMELALCLAPGLNVAGIEILYKAIKPALQVGGRLPVTVIGGALPRSLGATLCVEHHAGASWDGLPAQERQCHEQAASSRSNLSVAEMCAVWSDVRAACSCLAAVAAGDQPAQVLLHDKYCLTTNAVHNCCLLSWKPYLVCRSGTRQCRRRRTRCWPTSASTGRTSCCPILGRSWPSCRPG